MNRAQRDELAIDAARVFARLFCEYTSAETAVREVIEQMSTTAVSSDADGVEREMALATLADALGLLLPAASDDAPSKPCRSAGHIRSP